MSEQTSAVTGEPRVGAPNIYPCLGYRDAKAAIRWLCEAFGFEERMVHPGEDREVAHAELGLGPGIIMLGSANDDMAEVDTDALTAGGEPDFSRIPFALYVAVEDVDTHCERARAAGAEIVREPTATDYGSREYACRDLEGNVWSFGTYRPAAG
ncbi:MAG: VOC family protein [Solirubrobacterales bacterium]